MKKEVIWEIGAFGLTLAENIPMSVDVEEDDDREKPKQLPESCALRPTIRIRIKQK
jgi:hypothetical protein